MPKIKYTLMASIFKTIVRNTVTLQTITKSSMFHLVSNKLGTCQCSYGEGELPPNLYDIRKYGHDLSKDNVLLSFEAVENIPTGVFRDTIGEILGLGAGKCCVYQNPEYFSYHHMSFYDLNLGLRQYRLPCSNPRRKPS